MARVSSVATGTPISSTTFGNALITDYLSQTDTAPQYIASDLIAAITRYLTYPTVKTDTLAERTAAAGIAVSHDMNGAAGKTLAFPKVKADNLEEKTALAGINANHDMNFAAGKRPKADLLLLNPAAVPGTPLEGMLYYDSTTHTIKLRTDTGWIDLLAPPTFKGYVTLNQASPVQNTWYTLLDTVLNVRINQVKILVNTTGETLQVRITIDGITLTGNLACTANTEYYVNLTGNDGTVFTGLGSGYQLWIQNVDSRINTNLTESLEGKSVKIEVRKTTAAGTGNLRAVCHYHQFS